MHVLTGSYIVSYRVYATVVAVAAFILGGPAGHRGAYLHEEIRKAHSEQQKEEAVKIYCDGERDLFDDDEFLH